MPGGDRHHKGYHSDDRNDANSGSGRWPTITTVILPLTLDKEDLSQTLELCPSLLILFLPLCFLLSCIKAVRYLTHNTCTVITVDTGVLGSAIGLGMPFRGSSVLHLLRAPIPQRPNLHFPPRQSIQRLPRTAFLSSMTVLRDGIDPGAVVPVLAHHVQMLHAGYLRVVWLIG